MSLLQPTIIVAFTAGLMGFAVGEAPRKQEVDRYASLWNASPFTVKPSVHPAPDTNPMEDWALGGLSEVNGGYYMILLNRKSPGKAEIVTPQAESDFQVMSVRRDTNDYLKTQVQVSYQGLAAWIGYDEKLLTLTKGLSGNNPLEDAHKSGNAFNPQPGPSQPRQRVMEPNR